MRAGAQIRKIPLPVNRKLPALFGAAPFRPLPQPGLRLDAGVADCSVVGMHHDPMLAKLVAWAPSRQEAARMLLQSLEHTEPDAEPVRQTTLGYTLVERGSL